MRLGRTQLEFAVTKEKTTWQNFKILSKNPAWSAACS